MSSNFPRVYSAHKWQDWEWNPDILAPDCVLSQQFILGPQVSLLVPKLASDQSNNQSSSSDVFEYIFGHSQETCPIQLLDPVTNL